MQTGRTSARDPQPGGLVSARNMLGGISIVNFSLVVSTRPAHDTSAELWLVASQTRTSLLGHGF